MSRVPSNVRQQVRQRAENRCEYCRKPEVSGFFSHQVDHNFLGMFGVLRAPRDAGQIHRYERPVMPLIVMALLAIALLLVVHVLGLRA